MVLDPSFELHFPNAANDGYLGLLDLRRDPSALHRRLTELQTTHVWPATCFLYPETYATYDRASTMNWNKNSVTRILGGALFAWAGQDLYHWARPVALEEPKLLAGLLAAVLAVYGLFELSTGTNPGDETPAAEPDKTPTVEADGTPAVESDRTKNEAPIPTAAAEQPAAAGTAILEAPPEPDPLKSPDDTIAADNGVVPLVPVEPVTSITDSPEEGSFRSNSAFLTRSLFASFFPAGPR